MSTLGNAVRIFVRTIGELFITAGLLILLFLVWQLWWTDVVADREQAQTVTALAETFDRAEQAGQTSPGNTGTNTATPTPLPGDAFAIVHIPRFGVDYARPIFEDTDLDILAKGVGHYVDTAMPGEIGNFAIAGHRTTYGKPFNQIAELRPGDTVVIETAHAYSRYVVERHHIVRPTNTDVIAPVPDRPGEAASEAWLTMTSCHPMWSARERYIVHAKLAETVPRADATLAEVIGG